MEVDGRWAILSAEGEQLCTAAELILACRQQLLQRLDPQWFMSEQFRLRVLVGTPAPFYVEETIPETHLVLIENVALVCTASARLSAMQMAQGQLLRTAYSYGYTKSADEKTNAVITKTLQAKPHCR